MRPARAPIIDPTTIPTVRLVFPGLGRREGDEVSTGNAVLVVVEGKADLVAVFVVVVMIAPVDDAGNVVKNGTKTLEEEEVEWA